MRGRLSQISRTRLSQTPLLTPIMVDLENPEEAGLAIRTVNLFSFRRQGLPLLVRPISYQGKEGVWVAAIAFHIASSHGDFLEGAIYLNPRNAGDLRLLQCLIKQDRFPILFLTPQLQVMVNHSAKWTVHQRQGLRQMLAQAAPLGISGATVSGANDPDFERGKREFEKICSIKHLLKLQTVGTIRASSPFRGAVLE